MKGPGGLCWGSECRNLDFFDFNIFDYYDNIALFLVNNKKTIPKKYYFLYIPLVVV